MSGLVSDLDRDPITYSIVTAPLHGTVALTAATGAYRYTPAADFNGDDSFTYGASDGEAMSQAVLRISVAARNDLPVMQDDAATTQAGTAVEVDVLANDRDPEGGALSLLIVQAPQGGNAVVTTANTILFTPAPGFEGSTSLVYRATDPTVALPTPTWPSRSRRRPTMRRWRSARLSRSTRMDRSRATCMPSSAMPMAIRWACASPPCPCMVWSPSSARPGCSPTARKPITTAATAFSFAAKDPDGAEAQAGVSITINSVNDAPEARADQSRIVEDTVTSGNVLENDRDVDGDALTARLAAGTQTSNGLGVLDFASDGQWQFRPNQDANGTVIFTYLVSDGQVESPATLTIVVQAVNDRPVALADVAAADEDTALDGNVLGNDRDVDSPVLTATLLVGSASALGELSLAVDGAWHFEPLANAFGTVTYLYRVSDGDLTADASLTITLRPVNDAPVAGDDRAITAAGTPIMLTLAGLLANDGDVDGDPLSITLLSGPVGGHGAVRRGSHHLHPPCRFLGARRLRLRGQRRLGE